MAAFPYFAIGPTAIISIFGLLRGPDKTIPTPPEDWRKAKLDVVIPTLNEEHDIITCLASVKRQSFQPDKIFLIDDASQDNTVVYAKVFKKYADMNLVIIERKRRAGKVASLMQLAEESTADVLFVLDADTLLESKNYFARLVEEMYKGIGIASSSGYVMPLLQRKRSKILNWKLIKGCLEQHPEINIANSETKFGKFLKGLINLYRSVVYVYLQNFLYHGQMVMYGSLIGPLGCSVAYRRKYLQQVFDRFKPILGTDLTRTEDIFIGLAFIEYGYRNVHVHDVTALTQEPKISELPSQLKRWSSGFLQSCLFFDPLLYTPFKSPKKWIRKLKAKYSGEEKRIQEKRKIKEAYRQAFGLDQTQRYGRPIGWIMLTLAIEKFSYPSYLIIILALQAWVLLAFTLIAEIIFFTLVTTIVAPRKQHIKFFFLSLLIAPFRYITMFYDIFIVVFFIFEIWIKRKRRWTM